MVQIVICKIIDSVDYIPGIGNFDYNVQACQVYPHLDFHEHLAYMTSPLSYVLNAIWEFYILQMNCKYFFRLFIVRYPCIKENACILSCLSRLNLFI